MHSGTPPTSGPHMIREIELDYLRAIAIVGVILVHTA
jgi:peptidoglycan/LPS O-acetylase OafA/YrhL